MTHSFEPDPVMEAAASESNKAAQKRYADKLKEVVESGVVIALMQSREIGRDIAGRIAATSPITTTLVVKDHTTQAVIDELIDSVHAVQAPVLSRASVTIMFEKDYTPAKPLYDPDEEHRVAEFVGMSSRGPRADEVQGQ